MTMNKLQKLIQETLAGYKKPAKKSCSCGCNTCDTDKAKPMSLNENMAPKEILSEGLKYHINKKQPLTENVYRAGSERYFDLWAEARALYSRGILEINNQDDIEILTETHLGHFGILEDGTKVPLDFIMKENPYQPIIEDIKIYGKTYESVNIENSYSVKDIESDDVSNSFIFTDKHGIKRKLQFFKGNSIKLLWFDPKFQEWTTEKIPSKYEDEKVMNTSGMILVKVILPKYGSFNFKALNAALYRLFRALIYNSLDISKYDMDFNDETMEIDVYLKKSLNEDKKKTPPIGKPKRGGSKKFYVYVRDKGKIKKVSFGDTSGLSAKINNPEARRAFAARHDCKNKKDKTKASYWSCRLPRYASLLGLKSSFSGFW